MILSDNYYVHPATRAHNGVDGIPVEVLRQQVTNCLSLQHTFYQFSPKCCRHALRSPIGLLLL